MPDAPTDPPGLPEQDAPSAPQEADPEASFDLSEPADAPEPPPPGLSPALDQARRELLDLSTRNRLLNMPLGRSRVRSVEVIDELSDQAFLKLVVSQKPMSFLDGDNERWQKFRQESMLEAADETDGLGHLLKQPIEEEELDEQGLPKRHTDSKLQTAMPSESLHKRLLQLFYDARTYEEEQGVNILFLALGFLEWHDAHDRPSDARARHAPLLLIPVRLERKSANTKFRIRYTEEDLATNLSLQAKLKQDFNIDLPDLPAEMLNGDDTLPSAYFDEVEKAIANAPGWSVKRDTMVLSFFSFSKFLMYRDLDAESWPVKDGCNTLGEHAVLDGLLAQAGFEPQEVIADVETPLDEIIAPEHMTHVVDADSSQALAVEHVRRGNHLVIQGPPGTGKSQTIANLIAAAVCEGKRVLFVAEKMAALEVVKRRLDKIGLGDIALELHSHKANKRTVLAELERTMSLAKPQKANAGELIDRLTQARDLLNQHADTLHREIAPMGLTPYQIVGELITLTRRHIPPADFALVGWDQWTPEDRRQRTQAMDDLTQRVDQMGQPNVQPWRGVMLPSILPMDIQRLTPKLPPIASAITDWVGKLEALSQSVDRNAPKSFAQAGDLLRIIAHLASLPACDAKALADPAWSDKAADLSALLEAGRSLTQTRSELDAVFTDAAWDVDLTPMRTTIAAHGGSLLRILNGGYRKAMGDLRGILKDVPPKPLDERLAVIDKLSAGQKSLAHINEHDALGQAAFGDAWRRDRSDFHALTQLHDWVMGCGEDADDCREIAAHLDDPTEAITQARQLRRDHDAILADLTSVFGELELDTPQAFGKPELADVNPSDIATRLEQWHNNPEAVSTWIAYRQRRESLYGQGLGELIDRLHDGRVSPDEASDFFEMAYLENTMRLASQSVPTLAQFDGEAHGNTLDLFCQLDKQRIKLAGQQVAQTHFASLPRGGGSVGQVGLLRREFKKKRRHLPLRRLTAEAGEAIQRIKPVFMMSPLSVAQYLEPGSVKFDLLLIDEASQVRPVDALGAIARCEQIVVVGDNRQLPPTRFFEAFKGEDEEPDDDNVLDVGDLESILDLCAAQGLPQSMLQWHYRSKHPSLIAVSNHEFYDNNLVVIPHPHAVSEKLGLRFHHVEDGIFDRGKTASNRIEARAVAEAAIEHARNSPEHSLGVGAFSVAQRDAILDELEQLLRDHRDVADFFAHDAEEPFFVKNLENIQGDERDVIFISVGYGKDAQGKLTMNFGPLSNEGGERRLNVLITRSKRRCEVFSSITGDDIDLNRVSKHGPKALKTFLDYARHGVIESSPIATRGQTSAFEQAVMRELEAAGYKIQPRVGVAGFYVDLAVVDPEDPKQFLMGILCDGEAYHSARWARGRDRARRAVLNAHGWTLHRLWSLDWFRRPHEQAQRLLDAIDHARKAAQTDLEETVSPADVPEPADEQADPLIPRAQTGDRDDDPDRSTGIPTEAYQMASFTPPRNKDLTDLTAAGLGRYVRRVIEVESPIHVDEVARRVVDLWGTRMGKRVRESIDAALAHEARSERIRREGEFAYAPGPAHQRVRDRSDASDTLRKPDTLPPDEIRWALCGVVAAQIGVDPDAVVTEVARLLGFSSTREALRTVVEPQIDALVVSGELENREGRLYLHDA